ncbi:hypothetical protein AS156_39485 [Bradyrhizobium macuxiense]|uniref:Zinc/iron-chelating domain-containing protein n=1 Tax=Bradyrhizobium macuxiense TaxID=1755647 RepID=A0A125Q9H7_9BRAD|nr:hypothetical protein [Bradyrhizobium macuxiense]KWV57395.1 hypothetical protein AS156_39485 [Bradyrhizobium macuxiense]
MPAAPNANARRCGECTACCDGWLKIRIGDHDVKPGHPCPFSGAGKCAIYDTRPVDPCRNFVCGWLAPTSPLPEWMRPDRSHLIFLPASFTWRTIPVDVAVAVGARPRAKARAWLEAFSRDARRPLLLQADGEWQAHGPPDFLHDMVERLARTDDPTRS